MVLAATTPQAEREDDRMNSEGVLVLENKSASIPTLSFRRGKLLNGLGRIFQSFSQNPNLCKEV